MAIEVKVNVAKEGKREYPYLGRTTTGLIVLFEAKCCGTNVNGITSKMGLYSINWAEHDFTPLSPSESITLSNKG